MNRPTMLLQAITRDAYLACRLPYDDRDMQYVACRVEQEGDSFLTITLPSLCDALETGLTRGYLILSDFNGFRRASRKETIPAYMQGMFRCVFDSDGVLLDDPLPEAIEGIRQVTRAFKKMHKDCTEERKLNAFRRYLENERKVSGHQIGSDRVFDSVAYLLWSDLEHFAELCYCSYGVFGNGATQDRLLLNARRTISEWPERGELTFPLSAFASHREDDLDAFNRVKLIPVAKERRVKVTSVPKTLKTPRIISIEPSYMMLRQQSVAKPLMAYLEANPLTCAIRFTDQNVNREMARLGSESGGLATIDLSDASDLVSMSLVQRMLASCPSFLALCEDSRTTHAKMPDGVVVELSKFASMGSAMCFPMEAMVFLTIVLTELVKADGIVPSRKILANYQRELTVYGDDIIVPAKYGSRVCAALESFGLKVNRSKTFIEGFFRESCGADWYRGHNVTPIYIRREYTGKRYDAEDIASLVSTSNQFYKKGYWHTAQYLRSACEQRIGSIPFSTTEVGVLTFLSFFRTSDLYWDQDRYTFKQRSLKVQAGTQDDPVTTIQGGFRSCFEGRLLHEQSRSGRPGRRLDVGRDHYHPSTFVGIIFNDPQRGTEDGGDVWLNLGSVLPDPDEIGSQKDLSRSVRRHASRLKRAWSLPHVRREAHAGSLGV